MSTIRILPWLLLSSLAVAACGDEQDSGNDDEAAMDDDDSDDDDSDDDDSDDDDSDNDDSDNDDSDDDDSGAGSCDGDWYLGSVPFVGDSFIEACDDSPPRNCLTGNYIVFGDGECFCLPECAAAGLSAGDACTDDGSIVCSPIENDEGTSSGVFCVPPQWGLCG